MQRHERVLEIGAGSGYMAALLAHKAQHVTTVEIDAELARLATENLKRAWVMNASVVVADASAGLLLDGPFDVIVLSGSVAEVPRSLLGQLKPGGRLTAIVGQLPIMRAVLMTRGHDSGPRDGRAVRHRGAAPGRLRRAEPLRLLSRRPRLRQPLISAGSPAGRRHRAARRMERARPSPVRL